MTFAEKLKSIRKQAGMSQEKLAEKLGVSRQAVTKWETDAGIPDIENIDFQIYSLYDLFRTKNIKIQDISHAFSTTKVHNTDARFLNLENDTSVIYVDITSSLIDNQVVEYTEVLVRPEFSKYYTDGIFKNGIYQVNAQVVI